MSPARRARIIIVLTQLEARLIGIDYASLSDSDLEKLLVEVMQRLDQGMATDVDPFA